MPSLAEIFQNAAKLLFIGSKGPSRFGPGRTVLGWALVSLASIALIGDCPVLALSLAIAGGLMLGFLAVLGADRP